MVASATASLRLMYEVIRLTCDTRWEHRAETRRHDSTGRSLCCQSHRALDTCCRVIMGVFATENGNLRAHAGHFHFRKNSNELFQITPRCSREEARVRFFRCCLFVFGHRTCVRAQSWTLSRQNSVSGIWLLKRFFCVRTLRRNSCPM